MKVPRRVIRIAGAILFGLAAVSVAAGMAMGFARAWNDERRAGLGSAEEYLAAQLRLLAGPDPMQRQRAVDQIYASSRPSPHGVRLGDRVAAGGWPYDQVVPVLAGGIRSSDPYVRVTSIMTLGELGPCAASATLDLLEVIGDPRDPADSHQFRMKSANALGKFARGDLRVAAALAEALSDPAPHVRWDVAEALGQIGVRDGPILEALGRATTDPDENVRRSAARALSQLR